MHPNGGARLTAVNRVLRNTAQEPP